MNSIKQLLIITAITALTSTFSTVSAEVGGKLGVLDGSDNLEEKQILSHLPDGWTPQTSSSDGTGIKDIVFQKSAGSTLLWRLDDSTSPLATRAQIWLGGYTKFEENRVAGLNDSGLLIYNIVRPENDASVLILWQLNSDGTFGHAKWMGGKRIEQGAWRIKGMAGDYLVWQLQSGNRPMILSKITHTGGTDYTQQETWLGGLGNGWDVVSFEDDKLFLVNGDACQIWTLDLSEMNVKEQNWVGRRTDYLPVGFNGNKILWKDDDNSGDSIVTTLTFDDGDLTDQDDVALGQLGTDYDVGGFEGNEIFRYNLSATVTTITGNVADDGSPAVDTDVQLLFDHDTDGSFDQVDSTTTDSDGDFSFSTVPDTSIDMYQVKVLGDSAL